MDLGPSVGPDGVSAALAVFTERLAADASRPICVAFSGGSDSLALLHVAQRWARRTGRPITALTVDHGLNARSADWTAAAGAAAARLGVGWRGLVWTGDKPARGLPAAARAARHALLAAAARDLGAGVILMGHTADDVAESAVIREATPGHGRLRAWAPSPAWPDGRGVFLLRPLLAARRADLRVWLSAQGLGWLEDPANVDPRFARSRARAELADGRQIGEGWVGEGWVGEGWAISAGDVELKRLALCARATADGRLVLSRQALAQAPVEAARRLASAALVCAGGGARPPRGAGVNRLLAALAAEGDVAITLAGARVTSKSGDDAVAFGRDVGERTRGGLQTLHLPAGGGSVFDGRIEARAYEAPVRIAALCGLIGRLDRRDRMRLRDIPAWARGALPAVVDAHGVVRLPAPFGDGRAIVRSLVGPRFDAACGLVGHEAELATSIGMAL